MPEAPPFRMQSYGGSDIGRRRTVNEDAYLCDDEIGLWVVADGMGGHAAGEVASAEAIDTVHGMVKRGKTSLKLEGPLTEERSRAAARLLEGAVQAATYIVYAMAVHFNVLFLVYVAVLGLSGYAVIFSVNECA